MTDRECTFCGDRLDDHTIRQIDMNIERLDCPTCGRYIIFSPDWEFTKIPDRHLISGYIREQNELRDIVPEFRNPDQCEKAKELTPTRIPDMAARLLSMVQHKAKFFGHKLDLEGRDYPFGYCKNIDEFNALLNYCRDRRWLDFRGDSNLTIDSSLTVTLTADGFAEVETRAKANVDSDKAFIAMRFSDEMNAIYADAIKPAIKECGYRPVRIDQEEFNGDIIDRMLAEIRESRFIVADFTEHRPGVYFEAGFALGLSLPVIWTCHEDHIGDAHFDTNHFSHVVWSSAEQLRDRLINRIRATIGHGPLKSD